jgi:hypothetical protein
MKLIIAIRMNQDFQFMSATEIKHFAKLFNESLADEQTEEISFEDFREIVLSYSKFNRNISLGLLEKIKKKMKERMSSQSDADLYICNFYMLLFSSI